MAYVVPPRMFAAGDLVMPRGREITLHEFGDIIADTTGLTGTRPAPRIANGNIGIIIGTRTVTVAGHDRSMLDVMFKEASGSIWPHDLDIVVQARQQ